MSSVATEEGRHIMGELYFFLAVLCSCVFLFFKSVAPFFRSVLIKIHFKNSLLIFFNRIKIFNPVTVLKFHSHRAHDIYVMRWTSFTALGISVCRFESPPDVSWRPSSPLSSALAAHYDTLLSLFLCIFAALNISAIGLMLLLLSTVIFISTPTVCLFLPFIHFWL